MRQDYNDPLAIDWHDPLNPECYPQWWDNADAAATLNTPLFLALRTARNLEPRIIIAPDNSHYVVRPRGAFEQRFQIPAGSILWGMANYSKAAAGYKIQIVDLATGATLFSGPTANQNAGGKNTTGPVRSIVTLLQRPIVITPPGLLSVQITNSDAGPADNELQAALYFAVPVAWDIPDAAYQIPANLLGAPNASNAGIDAEIPARLAALRDTQGYSIDASNATASSSSSSSSTNANPPYLVMPANGRPFLYSQTTPTPAPGTIDAPVVSFVVPQGYSAAVRKVRNLYTGPGFEPGLLIWRLQIDGASPPGFDQITDELGRGSYEELSGAIIATAGSTVRYTVSVDPAAILPEATQCALAGHFYPQGA